MAGPRADFKHRYPARGPARRAYRKASVVSEEELVETLRTHRFEINPTARALGVARGSHYDLIAKSSRVRKAADLRQDEIEEALQAAGGSPEAAAQALEVSDQGLKRRMKSLGMR
jgi:two-component system nitrogen regulation response regulator GlnG